MKAVFAFFFLACVARSAWCQVQPVKGTESSFRVEVSINEASLRTDVFRRTGMFLVETKVKNISHQDQSITVWQQQGWSWISDNSDVVIGTEAAKNNASKMNLKPAQAYQGAVEMFVDAHKTKPVTFRLGFFPKAKSSISGQPNFVSLHSKELAWSNLVTLTRLPNSQ